MELKIQPLISKAKISYNKYWFVKSASRLADAKKSAVGRGATGEGL
jgi:hypothetical protein